MNEDSSGILGKWLSVRCEKEGLSLRQAAAKTKLSHATIREIINGAHASPESIKKLAQAFSNDGRHRLVLEDKLLVLAGHRTAHPEDEELSEPMAQLIDKLSQLGESQLRIVGRFTDFLTEMEGK